MPLGWLGRVRAVRAGTVGIVVALVWSTSACSDEDLVDTIPPPRPNRTTSVVTGPPGASPATSTLSPAPVSGTADVRRGTTETTETTETTTRPTARTTGAPTTAQGAVTTQ